MKAGGSSRVPAIGAIPSRNVCKRKCCNFENGDGGGPERNWAARFQAARSNSWSMNRFCWRTSLSLTHRACPFRIMCIASYPASELLAHAKNDKLFESPHGVAGPERGAVLWAVRSKP
jgi:hypothetical protein